MSGLDRFVVYGLPAPQGSKRHVGNGVMVESSKALKPWREDVRQIVLGLLPCVERADGSHDYLPVATFTRPLAVEITFTLPRPKGHWRTGRNATLLRDAAPAYPAGKPDVDKLARAVLDAIGSVGHVWRDDAQVVDLTARKVYPGGHPDALDRPGALIKVQVMPS